MKSLKFIIATALSSVSIMFSGAANSGALDAIGSFYIPNATLHIEQEIRCLAKNIFHEAGAEPYEGKVAVAMVTVNRAKSPAFKADTVCGVVKQKDVVRGKTVCQFSWYCTPKAKAVVPINTKGYQDSLKAAKKVLLEGYEITRLKHAVNFHTIHVSPNWRGVVKIDRIGNHIFYKSARQ